ncbi:MAG: DUF488 domain-containing protein [Candidatus Omnitrophica bacterium]|nr:DUF488 domain-containing protein [Candidatus Omnitrophota bacterium]
MKNIIYTIGYAGYNLEGFVAALKKYSIYVLADVRSSPYSQFRPEFNREALQSMLEKENIKYNFLGDKCGARTPDRECYINGKVDYFRLSKNPQFLEGISFLKQNSATTRIALMCAEKDPIACHRTILICRNLRTEDLDIKHILANGALEDNRDSEKRLLSLYRMGTTDLFKSGTELVEEAYNKHGFKIAYEEKEELIRQE